MKRLGLSLLVLVVLVLAMPGHAGNPVTQTLRQEVKIQKALLANNLEALQRHQSRLGEVSARMDRLLSDLVRAEVQGQTLEALHLRDDDLRQVESEMEMHLLESHRLRTAVIASRSVIEELEEEIERLESSLGRAGDPLTGTWRVVIEPDGQEGLMFLTLDGTLVQGTYRLDGDWFGSVRGTLVAGKVRLERVDSQVGFSAVYYGRLSARQDPPRIDGRWEATQLATGLPSGGTWMAQRISDIPDEE